MIYRENIYKAIAFLNSFTLMTSKFTRSLGGRLFHKTEALCEISTLQKCYKNGRFPLFFEIGNKIATRTDIHRLDYFPSAIFVNSRDFIIIDHSLQQICAKTCCPWRNHIEYTLFSTIFFMKGNLTIAISLSKDLTRMFSLFVSSTCIQICLSLSL